jgi:putative toxin-antitoxin system antitoxin component (TIGR02293 family)
MQITPPKKGDDKPASEAARTARVAQLLGLKVPKTRPSWEYIVGQIRSGLDLSTVKRLATYFDMELDDLLNVLALSARTYARKKSHGRALNAVQSDRAYRLAKIGVRAEEVFADKEIAHDWLRSYNRALGAKPMDLLDTQAGAEEIENVLGRIEHGVYS